MDFIFIFCLFYEAKMGDKVQNTSEENGRVVKEEQHEY